MTDIKVLNITEEGRGGGALYRIMDIADELRDQIQTIIIYPRDSERCADMIADRGLDGEPIALSALTREWRGLTRYVLTWPMDIWRLYRLIRRHRPALVYANGSWQIKGIIAAALTRTPSVWHMNDTHQPRPVRWLYRLISPLATGHVYASERTRQYYQQIYRPAHQVYQDVTPAPVDTERFSPEGVKVEMSDDVYHIVTTGYINPNKGLEQLIQAVAIVRDQLPKQQIQYHIIGPVLDSQRSYKRMLDQLITDFDLDNMNFVGYQSDTAPWLRAADVYLCSSRYESSPIAVWEAMACGAYVISTDVGDMEQIASTYQCAKVVPVTDPEAIAKAIIDSISDQGRSTQQESARKTAIEAFSLSRVAQQHLTTYQKIVTS